MRDFQRSKVYDWEYHCLRDSKRNFDLPELSQVQEFVDMILAERRNKLKVKAVQTYRKNAVWAWAKYDPPRIELPLGWGRKSDIILHEVSHHIARDIAEGPAHGTLFVSVYIDLINRYMNIDTDVLVRSLSRYKVKHSDMCLRRLQDD